MSAFSIYVLSRVVSRSYLLCNISPCLPRAFPCIFCRVAIDERAEAGALTRDPSLTTRSGHSIPQERLGEGGAAIAPWLSFCLSLRCKVKTFFFFRLFVRGPRVELAGYSDRWPAGGVESSRVDFRRTGWTENYGKTRVEKCWWHAVIRFDHCILSSSGILHNARYIVLGQYGMSILLVVLVGKPRLDGSVKIMVERTL